MSANNGHNSRHIKHSQTEMIKSPFPTTDFHMRSLSKEPAQISGQTLPETRLSAEHFAADRLESFSAHHTSLSTQDIGSRAFPLRVRRSETHYLRDPAYYSDSLKRFLKTILFSVY